MFTGIVQSVAQLVGVNDCRGIRTFEIRFEDGFCSELEIGASIAVDGVCLTVTEILSPVLVRFDVILQSLLVTTLSKYQKGDWINVERAAKDGAEIGGHPLSGHIDFKSKLINVRCIEDNYCIRIDMPENWKRYIFPKGYIAINGASLTVAETNKQEQWFEVWLIPETRRMTTFEEKHVGDYVNVEIERGTQVVVDSVRDTINESLGPLLPLFEKFLIENGASVDTIAHETTKQLRNN